MSGFFTAAGFGATASGSVCVVAVIRWIPIDGDDIVCVSAVDESEADSAVDVASAGGSSVFAVTVLALTDVETAAEGSAPESADVVDRRDFFVVDGCVDTDVLVVGFGFGVTVPDPDGVVAGSPAVSVVPSPAAEV